MMRLWTRSIEGVGTTLKCIKKYSNSTDASSFLQSLKNYDILTPSKNEKVTSSDYGVPPRKTDELQSKKVFEELNRQLLLQKSIKAIHEEIRVHKSELRSHYIEEKIKGYKGSLTGKQYMSSGELRLEGSPQHLKRSEGQSNNKELIKERMNEDSALVSLIGHVCTDPVYDFGDKLCGVFSVEHRFYFDSQKVSQDSTVICVKCFGESLSRFALSNIRRGDIVHVLGTLLPPDNEGRYAIGVNAVGGNLSVVVPSE